MKGGLNGREERIRRNGALVVCRSGDDGMIIGKLGVLGAQLGLLKDAVRLVENHGKANPTGTKLLPSFIRVA